MPPRARVPVSPVPVSAPEMSSDARSTAESESSSESACVGSLPLSSSLPSLSGGPNACAATAAAAITSLAPAASAAAPLWKPDACSTARAAAFASASVRAREALTTPELTPEPAPELAPEPADRRGSARTDGSFGTTRRGISHSRPVRLALASLRLQAPSSLRLARPRSVLRAPCARARRPRGAWGEIQLSLSAPTADKRAETTTNHVAAQQSSLSTTTPALPQYVSGTRRPPRTVQKPGTLTSVATPAWRRAPP